jgi:hypothetical protein
MQTRPAREIERRQWSPDREALEALEALEEARRVADTRSSTSCA